MEEITDETKSIMRLEARIHRGIQGKPRLVGIVALLHVESSCYLNLLGEEVVGSSFPSGVTLPRVP